MGRFDNLSYGVVSIPTNPREWDSLSRDQCPEFEEGKADAARLPYRQLIGSMMYLMVGTRPNLAHPFSVLSGYLINHGRPHYDTALRLLAYVGATSQVGPGMSVRRKELPRNSRERAMHPLRVMRTERLKGVITSLCAEGQYFGSHIKSRKWFCHLLRHNM